MELDTHLELAFRVGYLNNEEHAAIQEDLNEVGRLKWIDALDQFNPLTTY
jgi:23S rRNA-intervening sequence protein